MNNIVAPYYTEYHGLSPQISGLFASFFGLMNIFARSLGGILSDWSNKKYGMRGRLWSTWIIQTIEGGFCIAMASVTMGMTSPDDPDVEDSSLEADLHRLVPCPERHRAHVRHQAHRDHPGHARGAGDRCHPDRRHDPSFGVLPGWLRLHLQLGHIWHHVVFDDMLLAHGPDGGGSPFRRRAVRLPCRLRHRLWHGGRWWQLGLGHRLARFLHLCRNSYRHGHLPARLHNHRSHCADVLRVFPRNGQHADTGRRSWLLRSAGPQAPRLVPRLRELNPYTGEYKAATKRRGVRAKDRPRCASLREWAASFEMRYV